MFLHVSGILFTGGLWYPSMPCCRSQVGVVSQHALQVSRPIPGGKLRGLASGRGVSRPTPKGEVEGSGLGSLQAHPLGSLQAHTGGLSRPTLGVSPGPQLGGLQAHTWGGSPGPHPGGVSQHTAGGTHPTGMYSCSFLCLVKLVSHKAISTVTLYYFVHMKFLSTRYATYLRLIIGTMSWRLDMWNSCVQLGWYKDFPLYSEWSEAGGGKGFTQFVTTRVCG